MTLDEAYLRFLDEKVRHEASSSTVQGWMALMLSFFGSDRLISSISTADLVSFREHRRSTKIEHGSGKRLERYPSARTINGSTEVFRRMIKYAVEVWSDERLKIDVGPTRQWTKIMLPVPKGRVRELQGAEQTRLFALLRPDYHDIIEFAILSGLRRSQLILEWENVNLADGFITYERKSERESDIGVLPLTKHMIALLERQRGRHERFVFTYEIQTRRGGRTVGALSPITYAGLGTTMASAVKQAGLTNWRVLHDLRHTAASRVARSSKGLKAVQQMLGHADIASTMIYVHAMSDDVRAAMESASPNTFPSPLMGPGDGDT